MKYSIIWLHFGMAQLGWGATAEVRFPTHRQSTWENHEVENTDQKWSKSKIITYFRLKRSIRAYIRKIQSIPGDFEI